jgi:hypothetical protein
MRERVGETAEGKTGALVLSGDAVLSPDYYE